MNATMRVLVVDDNVEIHRDFRKVLAPPPGADGGELAALQAALFGADGSKPAPVRAPLPACDLVCTDHGEDAVARVRQAVAAGQPFTLAFVDMRMPGGFDGVRTVQELWQAQPDLDVVICTAFSDQDLDAVAARLGCPERLLILKKPFEAIEVRQFVAASWSRRRVAAAAARVATADLAKARAEEELRARTQFLANVSHEIRTPMAAILGYANVLRDEELPRAQQLEHLGTICQAGDRLLQVLSDILEVAQLDQQTVTLDAAAMPLRQALEEAVAGPAGTAAGKGLPFALTGVEALPAQVLGDRRRLVQLVRNLAENAVKFTDHGRVDVRVAMAPGAVGARGRLRIEVIDTGIGIAIVDQQRLFSPFVQVDGSMTRVFGGTGLGLVIARRLAQAMNGDIAVSSTPGIGSTFTATVEVGLVVAAEPATPLPRLQAFVLLVDDARDNQLLVSRQLRAAGAEVAIAGDGQDGLAAWRTAVAAGRPFDLVVTDMQMPRLDGYGLARALRADGAQVPILALTAHALAEDRERCLRSGCNEYLSKPADRRRLVTLCAELLARGGRVANA